MTAVHGENHPSRRQTSAHEWVFLLAALAPETLNRTVSGVVSRGLFGQTAFTTSLANALLFIAAIADLHKASRPVEQKLRGAQILLPLAFLGQHLMCMTLDALSLIVGLELQNLAVLVLCGFFNGFAVEAAIKLLLLSAYSSAMLLMGNSSMMAVSGLTGWSDVALFSGEFSVSEVDWLIPPGLLVTVGLVWKIGAAPLHMWLVAVYQSVWTGVSLYVSTAPKLAAFGFWLKWQPIVHYAGDLSVAPFAFLSLLTGAVNALAQPLMKPLLAYSAVGMNGILLMAIHAAENGAFWVNLIVYLWTMTLAWPLLSDLNLVSLTDRFRAFGWALVAISLAGLPPLVGFVGKGMVFWHSLGHPALLAVALFSTGLSLVYYLYSLLLAYRAEGGPLLVKARGGAKVMTPALVVSVCSYGLSALLAFSWASQPLLLACAVLTA